MFNLEPMQATHQPEMIELWHQTDGICVRDEDSIEGITRACSHQLLLCC